MKIVVIGEICEDIFIYGITNRLSPEAPIPVFLPKYTVRNDGMGGNVINNILSILPNTKTVSIHQSEKITKTRYVDDVSNHMFLRIDNGEEDIKPLILNENNIHNIKSSDIVIVSDYNKGFLNDETLIKIGQLSKLSIIDTKRKLKNSILEVFDFFKLNNYEYNYNLDILRNFIEKVIITLGKDGVKYLNKQIPVKKRKDTIDVSGAGDTFTTSFIIKYYKTKNIEKSIKYANKMASKVVVKKGVTTP